MPWPVPGPAGRRRPAGRAAALPSSATSRRTRPGETARSTHGAGARRVLHHVGQRLLDDPVDGQLERGGERRSVPDVRRSTGVPDARTFSASSLRSTSLGAGRQRGRGLLVAKQAEHHPQLVLGGPADRLDRFECGAGLLRALAISRLPTPAWTVITASVWATTSCSSCAMRTRSSRTSWRARSASAARSRSRLLGQPGHVAPPGRDAVADEPARGQGRVTLHRLYGQRRGPARDGRVDERPAQYRGAATAAGIEVRLGSPEAAKYMASPSRRPNTKGCCPGP